MTVRITSPFGNRTNPVTHKQQAHEGIDIAVPVGTPIYSTAPGVVVRTYDNDKVSGNAIVIDHRPFGLPYLTSYVHLSRVDVVKGQAIDRSRPIGLSGGQPGSYGAGRSTGPHLHLGIRRFDSAGNTAWVDPQQVINWQTGDRFVLS